MGLKNVAKHARKIKHKKVEWRKGQSGMSNPRTTKHRLAAKRSAKKSELTMESLRKFNERAPNTLTQQTAQEEAEGKIDEAEGRSVASTVKESVISWATCASDMTVRSFRGLFDKFEESGKHREAIAMVAACSEVLRARGLALNETGYFAVLLSNVSTLRGAPHTATQQDDAAAPVTQPDDATEGKEKEKGAWLRTALFLLRLIVKRINRDVLRARFVRYAAALRGAFGAAQHDAYAMLELVPILRSLLVAQSARSFAVPANRDTAFWFIDRLCALLSNPSLRKCVASNLVSILRAQSAHDDTRSEADTVQSPLAMRVVDYCVVKLRAVRAAGDADGDASADGDADVAVCVGFAARCADALPAAGVRRLAEALLGVARRDARRFAAPVCDALAHLFASSPRAASVPLELTAKLLSALLDAVPTPTPTAVRARLVALRFGLANLTRLALANLRENGGSSDKVDTLRLLAAHADRAFETGLAELVATERAKAHEAAVELCRSVFLRLAEVLSLLADATFEAAFQTPLGDRIETVCCEVLSRLNAAVTLQNVASWRTLFSLVCDALRNLLPDQQNVTKPSVSEPTPVTDGENVAKRTFDLEERTNFRDCLIETLRRLASVRENAAVAVRDGDGETVRAIDECLAEALHRCDVHRTVWRAVRVELRFSPRFSVANDWLVPLLVAHARRSSLAFWHAELLPLATTCDERLNRPACAEVDAVSLRALVEQVWMLLGSACGAATDTDSLRLFGKLLADKLREATEALVVPEAHRTATHVQRLALGLSTLAALRKLIGAQLRRRTALQSTSTVQPEQQSDMLVRYAKNYLPLLFNLVTTEPPSDASALHSASSAPPPTPTLTGLQLAALETVRLYAALVEPAQLGDFIDKACQKLDEGSMISAFRRHALLDLLIALCPHADEYRADQLFARALAALNDVTPTSTSTSTSATESSADCRAHKKYYRVLETVCERASFACVPQRVVSLRTFVLSNLRDAATGVVKPRLKLLAKLIATDTERLTRSPAASTLAQTPTATQCVREPREDWQASDSFVDVCFPEAVLCLSSSSRSVRQLANTVVLTMLARFRLTCTESGPNAAVGELVRRLFALLGAAGGSEQLQVAVVRALSIGVEHVQSQSGPTIDADADALIVPIFDALGALVASATRPAVVRVALDLADTLLKRATDWPSVARLYDSCIIRLILRIPAACQRAVRFYTKRLFERAMRKAHDVHVVERAMSRIDAARLADFDRLLRNCRKRIERAWRKRAAAEENGSESESDDLAQSEAATKSMRSRSVVSAKSAKSRRSVVKSVAAILEEASGRGNLDQCDESDEQDESDDDRIVERTDEIVDLLDPEAVSNVRTVSIAQRRAARNTSEKRSTDAAFATAPDGRLILVEDRDDRRRTNKAEDRDDDADSLDQADILSGVQLKSVKFATPAKSVKSNKSRDSHKAAGSASRSSSRTTAGKSDAKRRGERFEPFAYVTLDRRTLNKRKRAKLSGRFEKLVKSAKRGAASGAKANAASIRKQKRPAKSGARAHSARAHMELD